MSRKQNASGMMRKVICCAISVNLAIMLYHPVPRTAWAAEGKARPNIIFFLADDMRWDAMGCAGNRIIQTPHLDRLAERGVRFTNGFVTTSICAVSRASLLTGQYESRHQIHDFVTSLSPTAFAGTFPALLRQSGYRTGFVGKWGVGMDKPVPQDRFDYWAGWNDWGMYFEKGDPEHRTQKTRKQALSFIRQFAAQEPFMLWVSFKAPHSQDHHPKQFLPEPRLDDLYKGVTIPVPKTANQESFEKMPPFVQTSENRLRWLLRFTTPQMFQESVKNYYRLISGIDYTVGEVLGLIDELKISENTVVIFSSDNGFFLGEHGMAGKWLMHEESIRIPLVIYDPKLPKARCGRLADQMVLNLDVAPTILDIAGVAIPEVMQGRSLKPLMLGPASEWRKEWFYEHSHRHPWPIYGSQGVRTERWKYIRYLDTEPLYEELFDLKNDPLEEHNLASDKQHVKVLNKMRQRFEAMRESAK
ncbi:MAG: sulfatase [Planctomycetota bacterium]|nr:MAG: sulfatase [Planctomycetota bacterium]